MKTDVLIVGKTKLNKGEVCIGGVSGSGKFLRLINPDGSNQPSNTIIDLRDIWRIDYSNRKEIIPPHNEDVIVHNWEKRSVLDESKTVKEFLNKIKVNIHEGHPNGLFENTLKWSGKGSGFLPNDKTIPTNSVGFWIPDRDLNKIQREDYKGIRYEYPTDNGNRNLPFKGFHSNPPEIIPSGTLLRVSLGRWWHGPNEDWDNPACFLQLSGWFDLDESNLSSQNNQNLSDEDPDDDLPF